jgi:hypothetical protein
MGDLSRIMNECCAVGMLGMMCGKPGERWYVFDGYARQLHIYEPNEVEYVTCESDAEQATPNGSVSG